MNTLTKKRKAFNRIERLGEKITERGGEFEVKNSLQEANTLLADKEYQVDEVISGTFSTGSLYGPWRTVQALAAERDLGFTLLTSLGHGISLQQAEELNKQGSSYTTDEKTGKTKIRVSAINNLIDLIP